MATSAPDIRMRQGVAALQAGDVARARQAFEGAIAAGGSGAQLWLYVAHARLLERDRAAAGTALDHVLAAEPRNLYALCMKGDLALAAGDDRSAASFYTLALTSAPETGLSPDLVERLRAAEAASAMLRDRFGARMRDALGSLAQAPARFREAIAILSGEAPPYPQAPTSFFYPRLAAIPFFDTRDMPWIAQMEQAAPAMRAELEAVIAQEGAFAPYVQAEPGRPNRGHALLDDRRWSARYLWRNGEPDQAMLARCPVTAAALAGAPIPRIDRRSPMALFSRLEPHTHIPPHNGMINTRLICHIPLIVPQGCRLRVGAETRTVEPYKAMLFDDSIEHEAWNDGDSVRVVLLFEVWRPELDAEERGLLTRMFDTVVNYAGQ